MIRGEHITWSPNFKMKWGKYQGENIRDVARTDVDYLKWLMKQSPSKFALDAAMAITIQAQTMCVPEETSAKAKLSAAIIRLFCHSLASSDEPFDESILVILNKINNLYSRTNPNLFLDWILGDESGQFVHEMARHELFAIKQTTILSMSQTEEETLNVVNTLINANKGRIGEMTAREEAKKKSVAFYEDNGITFGDW